MATTSTSELATVARPYAEAIFKRARETDRLDEWSDALAFLAQVIGDRRILGLVSSPHLTRAQLTDLLLDIAGEVLNDEGRNLVRLVVENGRAGALPEIARHYEGLKAEHQSRIDVEVTAAYSVSAAQKKQIAEAMKHRLGRDVQLSTRKDASLIGGAIIRAGDLVIDGSVRSRLRQMAARLNS